MHLNSVGAAKVMLYVVLPCFKRLLELLPETERAKL